MQRSTGRKVFRLGLQPNEDGSVEFSEIKSINSLRHFLELHISKLGTLLRDLSNV